MYRWQKARGSKTVAPAIGLLRVELNSSVAVHPAWASIPMG